MSAISGDGQDMAKSASRHQLAGVVTEKRPAGRITVTMPSLD
ncbi:hypothetical protein [Pseudomonas sp. LB3P58]